MWRPVAAGLVLVLGVQAMWAGAAWLTLPAVVVVWGLMLETWGDRSAGPSPSPCRMRAVRRWAPGVGRSPHLTGRADRG